MVLYIIKKLCCLAILAVFCHLCYTGYEWLQSQICSTDSVILLSIDVEHDGVRHARLQTVDKKEN